MPGTRPTPPGQEIDRAADAARFEMVTGGYTAPLFEAAAIGARERVLDIGCGYGRTTLEAARLAAGGHAVGNDISGPMLDQARRFAADEGIGNATFEQGDAQVHPFEAGGFDVVISRMGAMFFTGPTAAFTNLGWALRPGGRLAVTVTADPAENDLTVVLGAALSAYLPPLDQKGRPGLSSLAGPADIEAVLGRAGFESVTTTAVEAEIVPGRDVAEAAEFVLGWGAVRDATAGADAAAQARIRAALDEVLQRYAKPGGVRLRSTGWLVRATRP